MRNRSVGILHSVVSLRAISFVFCLLGVFVLCFFVLSTSRLSVIVDASIKIKSSVSNVVGEMAGLSGLVTANSTKIRQQTSASKPKLFNGSDSGLRDHFPLILGNLPRGGVTNTAGSSETDAEDANVAQPSAGNSLPRQDHCKSCFVHDFEYVIRNDDICKLYSDNQVIDLLVLIFTEHGSADIRQAIRTTWLSPTNNNTANVRYAFLLGEVKDADAREAMVEENKIFGDILKENFVDKYSNLTYKTIMGFKWAATFCSRAKFVMKTDHDMFVNIANILTMVKDHASVLQTHIGGGCHNGAPDRNVKSKWFASFRSYPNNSYPGFCSGTGYVTSMNVVRKVYEISPHVPFFHLEDVYVSLCVKELGYHLKGFPGFNLGRPRLDPCLYKGKVLKTSHQLTKHMLILIWKSQCRNN